LLLHRIDIFLKIIFLVGTKTTFRGITRSRQCIYCDAENDL